MKNCKTDDIPTMGNLNSDDSSSNEHGKEEAEIPVNDEGTLNRQKGEILTMDPEVASLKLQNKKIMKLLTQLPGAPTSVAT